MGRADNPKYYLYNQLVSHSIEEKKIQNVTNSGSISLPDESVKAPTEQVSIKEDPYEVNKPQIPNEEEASDPGEDWTLLESKDAKKRQECTPSKWRSVKQLI